MRHNFRKILAVMVLSASVLGLTACGSTAAEDEITFNETYLQSVSDFLIESWNGMPAEQLNAFASMDSEDTEELISSNRLPFTAEAFTTAFSGYIGNVDELGAYVSTDGYEAVVDGDEVTWITHLTYENRTADLSIVFNKKSVAQTVTLDPDYTIGEILEKALMNTILGMGSVFSVLILISLIIYCFGFIPAIQEKFSKKKETEKTEKAAPVQETVQPAAAEEETMDEGELVAAITAAICAYTGSSADGFVVRSIKRADSAKWKRA